MTSTVRCVFTPRGVSNVSQPVFWCSVMRLANRKKLLLYADDTPCQKLPCHQFNVYGSLYRERYALVNAIITCPLISNMICASERLNAMILLNALNLYRLRRFINHVLTYLLTMLHPEILPVVSC